MDSNGIRWVQPLGYIRFYERINTLEVNGVQWHTTDAGYTWKPPKQLRIVQHGNEPITFRMNAILAGRDYQDNGGE